MVNTKAVTNVYKVTPTFTMTLEDLESYRDVVMHGIKVNRMALMSDGQTVLWLDGEIAIAKAKEDKEIARLKKADDAKEIEQKA